MYFTASSVYLDDLSVRGMISVRIFPYNPLNKFKILEHIAMETPFRNYI